MILTDKNFKDIIKFNQQFVIYLKNSSVYYLQKNKKIHYGLGKFVAHGENGNVDIINIKDIDHIIKDGKYIKIEYREEKRKTILQKIISIFKND